MLQRSPSYVLSLPGGDAMPAPAPRLLGARAAYAFTRWKNVLATIAIYQLSRRRPERDEEAVPQAASSSSCRPATTSTRTSRPTYKPWDQRLCLVPDGDLFQAISRGQRVGRDRSHRHVHRDGIELESGASSTPTSIVTATGLNLLALGGVQLEVDGEPVELSATDGLQGHDAQRRAELRVRVRLHERLVDVEVPTSPASTCAACCSTWTRTATSRCTPEPTRRSPRCRSSTSPPGYVQRSIEQFPQQGVAAPWRLYQNYALDVLTLKFGSLQDGVIEFSGPTARSDRASEPVAA